MTGDSADAAQIAPAPAAAAPRPGTAGAAAATADPVPATSGLPCLPSPVRLPGRLRVLGRACLLVVLCTGTALALRRGPAGVPWVIPLFGPVFCGLLMAHRRERLSEEVLLSGKFRRLDDEPAAAALQAALRPVGIPRVILLASPGGAGFSGRTWRAAVIILAEGLLQRPDMTTFILAHEAAHAARRDTDFLVPFIVAAWICLIAIAFAWPLAAFALPGILVVAAAVFWTAELSCDRIAARWVGASTARSSLLALRRLQQQSRLSRRMKIIGRLIHPPMSLRLAVVGGRQAAQPEHSDPPESPGMAG